MKKISILALAVLMMSCNNNPAEKKREELLKYRQQAVALENKIAQLENEMALDSAGNGSGTNYVLVELKNLQWEPFSHFIEVSGEVEMAREAFISSEMNGQIETIHVREGARVKKGQLLVSLNTDVVQSSMDEVKTALDLAEKLYEKQKELWDQNIGSEIQYLQAKNSYESAKSRLNTLKAQMEMSLVRAPFEGIVDRIYRKEGELAVPGVQLLQLVNLDQMIIRAQVSESYLSQVRAGEPVEVRFPSYPDKIIDLPIYRTGNVIDEKSRTFEIEMRMENQDGRIKPNQMAVVRIRDFASPQALVIPSVIIKRDIRGLYVYVATKDEKNILRARKSYITTGLSYEDQTMVSSGLAPGQKVIVSGYNMVSDGIMVKTK